MYCLTPNMCYKQPIHKQIGSNTRFIFLNKNLQNPVVRWKIQFSMKFDKTFCRGFQAVSRKSNQCQMIFKNNLLPLHLLILQRSSSSKVCSPSEAQGLPPNFGVVHFRVLFLIPEPHGFEQVPHSCQFNHSPWTNRKNKTK